MKQREYPTIGFLIDWLENDYQVNIFQGVSDRAKERGLNLVTFVGGSINSTRQHELLRNSIYRYVSSENVDGIVMSAGSLGAFSTQEQMIAFIGTFPKMPVVSISQKYPNAYSILIDNKAGLKKAMRHMCEVHGYKRIGFVSGPASNQEAAIRLEAYKESLAEYGIEYRDELVVEGFFVSDSGKAAVQTFLDERRVKMDAIVAANDDMAWGVLEELEKRNIAVPGEIAVSGFDNQTLSGFTNPPLTTIAQPTYMQGKRAVDIIIDLFEGKAPDQTTLLETELVLRESCGCRTPVSGVLRDIAPDASRAASYSDTGARADAIMAAIRSSPGIVSIPVSKDKIEALLESHAAAVSDKDDSEFIRSITGMIRSQKERDSSEAEWQEFFSILRAYTSDSVCADDNGLFAETLWHRATLEIIRFLQREKNYKKERDDRQLQLFRDISEEFVAQSDIDEILRLLGRQLKNLSIKECYISLDEEQLEPDSKPENSRLIFAQNESFSLDLRHDSISFKTRNLIADGIIPASRRYYLIAEPIFFGDTHLGIALFEMSVKKTFVYNIMRRMFLNDAIKAAVFIQQMKRQAANLEDTNMELKKTLDTLRATQTKLIQSEKLAALANLVAGVAHEINTPLGVSVTATSHLEKMKDELKALFDAGKLRKSDLQKFIWGADDTVKMILFNLKRSHDLIRSFKRIAVDQSSEEERRFNVKEYIGEILLSLSPAFKHTEHAIDVQCPANIEMASFPGALSQIITNLVMNSFIHAYDDSQKGKITILVKEDRDSILFTYSDDGKGIEEKNITKVFTPFFTTKRGKGSTGLGLYITYNIVTQQLGGSIECKSVRGAGTTFTIVLPKHVRVKKTIEE